ncbi:MAG: GNAT family N-acetyltransferase [Actinomycetota bacterium]
MQTFPFTTKDGRSGVVRPAKPGDAKACLAVVWEATNERPRTLMTSPEEFWTPRQWRKHRRGWDPDGVWLVAEVDGTVCSSLGAERGKRPRERHVAEFGITVGKAYRDQGVGRAMLETLEVWAQEFAVERIQLRVFDTNARARALYERMGYADEGAERLAVKFPDEYIDAVRMAKILRTAGGAGRSENERHARG